MRLGQAAMEALRAEITGCLKPGDELVVACPVALKGTSVIAKNKKDKLAERFSAGFIQNCVSLWDAYGAGSIVWKIAQEADASALYAMGEGGFLSALWKMAEASEVGLEADFRKVPIRQETIEVCEIFDLNPYKLQADGAVLIGIRGGEALVQRLRNEGFMAEVIGQTKPGDDMEQITADILKFIEEGADMVVCSGGMSVDPDDRTPGAIKATGTRIVSYGAPVLPGAMMLVSYYEKDGRQIPILGLPGCVMYAKNTIFDLLLPRLMADDEITADEINHLGEGGLRIRKIISRRMRCQTQSEHKGKRKLA